MNINKTNWLEVLLKGKTKRQIALILSRLDHPAKQKLLSAESLGLIIYKDNLTKDKQRTLASLNEIQDGFNKSTHE